MTREEEMATLQSARKLLDLLATYAGRPLMGAHIQATEAGLLAMVEARQNADAALALLEKREPGTVVTLSTGERWELVDDGDGKLPYWLLDSHPKGVAWLHDRHFAPAIKAMIAGGATVSLSQEVERG